MSEKGAPKTKELKPSPLVRRSTQAILICAAATVALVALDLWTKDLAVENLSRERIGEPPAVCDENGLGGMQRFPAEPHVLIEGYLELRYAENCGAAFGLLDDAPKTLRRVVFGAAGVAATIFLFVLFVRGSGGPLFAFSVPLIVSGAVGNLVDRARLEYVVDFIRFHVQDSFEYPTFNVADITITVGVILLVIDGFHQERVQKRAAAAEAAAVPAPTPSSGKAKRKKPKKSERADEADEPRADDAAES